MKIDILLLTILLTIFVDRSVSNPTGPLEKNTFAENRGKSTAVSQSSVACFSSDTLINFPNGKQVPIYQLRFDDEILTTDGVSILTTNMIMMLDKHESKSTVFHTIITQSGHNVSLTSLHLIAVSGADDKPEYILARDVKVGHLLYVMSNAGQIKPSPVTEIMLEMKAGFYAPLTMSGTLLTNGIMTSCFANVKDHDAAQYYMSPLRLYHQIARTFSISSPFGAQNDNGIHFMAQMMYETVQSVHPTALVAP